mgnify:CR=1 FL=1
MQNIPASFEDQILRAKQAILQGDLLQAKSIAEQVLAEDADNVDALLILAGVSAPEESLGYLTPVSYTHLRAHETVLDLVCRLLLEKKKKKKSK